MFNINLNGLYTVEQVNQEVDSTKAPESWDNASEGGINDVVDPNTEFQIFDRSVGPASPLESYGFPTPPQTPAVFKKNTDSVLPEFSSPKRSSKSVLINKALNDNTDIPQVHVYVSNSKMAHGNLNMKRPSMVHSESDMIQYPKSDITIVTEHRSDIPSTPNSVVQEIITTRNKAVSKNSLSRTQPRHSFTMDTNCAPGIERATTSDQIAWAMRNARDRLETASNVSGCSSRFELESNCSEQADTMSTYSDVSGYEEELFRIRRLLLQDSQSSYFDKHLEKLSLSAGRKQSIADNEHNIAAGLSVHSSLDQYKENTDFQIRKLDSQLQVALAEKERFRIERDEAAEKAGMDWQQRYQEVLRLKANTDGRLETLQAEVDTLRGSTVDKLKVAEMRQQKGEIITELEKFRNMNRDAQSKIQEQSLQLELMESEVARWKAEASETDVTNESLRIQLQELNVDTEMKDGAIQGLKMKVADQHVELQTLLQAKLKSENNVVTIRNEMDTIRKSGTWYREQLHACQAAKVKVQQELMMSQANVVTYGHLVERLKSEAENLRSIAEETQQRAVREKDSLMRKLEKIHADMLEREAVILSQFRRDGSTSVEAIAAKLARTENNRESEMTNAIEEFEQQIGMLRLELKEREDKIQQTGTENVSLIQRITTLQKTLNGKDLSLNSLQIKYKNLEMNNNSTTEAMKNKEKSLSDIKNEKVVMEVALAAAAREKKEVDNAIEKLRDDVARITKSYKLMQRDLRAKEKEIELLHTELRGIKLERDQQIDQILKHGTEREQWREMQAQIATVGDLEQKMSNLSNTNDELNRKMREINETKDYSVQQMEKLNEMLTFREDQLLNQTRNFEVHAEELKSRDSLISTLNADKKSLLNSIEQLNSKITQIEEVVIQKSNQVDLTHEQIARCNFVIEQFNTLCRGSELENHHLKELMKELETMQILPKATKATCTTQTYQPNVVSSCSQTVEEHLGIHVPSTPIQVSENLKKELEQVKCSLRMSDVEKKEKQRRYETNIRTLLKKVKEHMRGRKVAEKALAEIQSSVSHSMSSDVADEEDVLLAVTLRNQVTRLEAEVELGRQQFTELKKITECSEKAVLELEKERGKLVQVQSVTPNLIPDTANYIIGMTFDSNRIEYLEEELRKQQIIVKDLKKETFIDRRDNSQLRKQVSSLQMGLDLANDVLDNKKIDLGRSEAMNEVLRNTIACLQQELEKEQVSHEECKQVVEKLKMELEETRAKDPMLADQIKMLSYHLHEKSQEAANLQEHRRLSEERWANTENSLKQNINRLRDEIASLRGELDTVRADKFTLQAQAVELRVVLQSSLDQNKLLRHNASAYANAPSTSNDSTLPDLTSSLPSAPLKYDEREIAELLQPNRAMPRNAPLNNLQSCLDLLKQEMATLQEQLIAKTSHHPSKGITTPSNGVHEV